MKLLFPVHCYWCAAESEEIVCPECLQFCSFLSSQGRCRQCFLEKVSNLTCAQCKGQWNNLFWSSLFPRSPLVKKIFTYAYKGKVAARSFFIDAIIRKVAIEDFVPEVVVGVQRSSWSSSDLLQHIIAGVAKAYDVSKRRLVLSKVKKTIPQEKRVLVIIDAEDFSVQEQKLLATKLQESHHTEFFCLTLFEIC